MFPRGRQAFPELKVSIFASLALDLKLKKILLITNKYKLHLHFPDNEIAM